MKLTPKEQFQSDLPEQVGGLLFINETLASVDYEAEIEGGKLRIVLKGLYLGKTEEPPSREASKKWTLA
jgi:hypothetical protein